MLIDAANPQVGFDPEIRGQTHLQVCRAHFIAMLRAWKWVKSYENLFSCSKRDFAHIEKLRYDRSRFRTPKSSRIRGQICLGFPFSLNSLRNCGVPPKTMRLKFYTRENSGGRSATSYQRGKGVKRLKLTFSMQILNGIDL